MPMTPLLLYSRCAIPWVTVTVAESMSRNLGNVCEWYDLMVMKMNVS